MTRLRPDESAVPAHCVRHIVRALLALLAPLAFLAGLGLSISVWQGSPAVAQASRPGEPDAPELLSPLTDDPRSTILLLYGCRSDAGRQEVTLFADGTVRLREVRAPGAQADTEGVETEKAGTGAETMELYELDPDSLEAYRARLADEDLSEVDMERNPVDGAWVEACRLDLLRYPPSDGVPADQPPEPLHFQFSRYSALPLALSRVVKIAQDLIAEVDAAPRNHLPDGYEPRPGDVLERSDGVLFEVVDFTVDGKGVELSGVEAPLVLYLPPDALRQRFVRVVSREGAWESEDGGR